MNRLKNILTWLAIALIVLLAVVNVLVTIYSSKEREKAVDRAVKQVIESMPVERKTPEVIKGKDGYTPVKGVDYFDGAKGDKGEVGLKGDKGDRGDAGKAGENGKDSFLDIKCNLEKNRWEIKLSPLDKWQVLNGESVKCSTEQEVK